MNRRRFLAGAGVSLGSGLAGCLGGRDDGHGRADENDRAAGDGDDPAAGPETTSEPNYDSEPDPDGDAEEASPESAALPDDTAPVAQFQSDAENTGVVDTTVPGAADVQWHVERASSDAGLSVAEGRVVVAGPGLAAFDVEDGSDLWSVSLPGWPAAPPTLTSDTAYVAEWGPPAEHGVSAFALDDGGVRWRAVPDVEIATAPTLSDDTVFVGGSLNSELVVALDARTGAEQWRTPVGEHASTPAVADGTVYVGGGEAEAVVALDAADGDEQWRVETADEVSGAPTVSDDVVYAGDRNGTVTALDAESGDEFWDTRVDFDVRDSIAVTDDALYVPGERDLTALDHDGEELWSVAVSSGAHAPTVASDGVVFTDRQELVCVDVDEGSERWRHDVPTRRESDMVFLGIRSPPAVTDGAVHVVSHAGDVFRIE